MNKFTFKKGLIKYRSNYTSLGLNGARKCLRELISAQYTGHQCGTDEFKCDNGQCIKYYARCNNDADCSDGSDETSCGCSSDQFPCPNKKCISLEKLCDGKQDCDGGLDEKACGECLQTRGLTFEFSLKTALPLLCGRLRRFCVRQRLVVILQRLWCSNHRLRECSIALFRNSHKMATPLTI